MTTDLHGLVEETFANVTEAAVAARALETSQPSSSTQLPADSLEAYHYLNELLGLQPFEATMSQTDTPPALYGGRLLVVPYDPHDCHVATAEDLVPSWSARCQFCSRLPWNTVSTFHDAIVAAARHLTQHPTGRVIVNRKMCWYGCVETFVVLVSAYLSIEARRHLTFASEATLSPLPSDILALVVAHLDHPNRLASARVCKAWPTAEAIVLLSRRFATLLPRGMFTWMHYPRAEGLVVAWALTKHWLATMAFL